MLQDCFFFLEKFSTEAVAWQRTRFLFLANSKQPLVCTFLTIILWIFYTPGCVRR